MVYISLRPFHRNHFPGNPHHHTVLRYILRHHAVRADCGIVPNHNLPDDLRTWPDIDVIPDLRNALALTPAGHTNCHTVGEVAVRTNGCSIIRHDPAVMANIKPEANFLFVRNRNSKLYLVMVVDQPRQWENSNPPHFAVMQVAAKAHPEAKTIAR